MHDEDRLHHDRLRMRAESRRLSNGAGNGASARDLVELPRTVVVPTPRPPPPDHRVENKVSLRRDGESVEASDEKRDVEVTGSKRRKKTRKTGVLGGLTQLNLTKAADAIAKEFNRFAHAQEHPDSDVDWVDKHGEEIRHEVLRRRKLNTGGKTEDRSAYLDQEFGFGWWHSNRGFYSSKHARVG